MPVELPDELFSILRTGAPALLLTVDENGFPHTAFTFAATHAKGSVAFVVDEKSTTEKNILRTRQASVQIIAARDCIYLLKGSVRLDELKLKHSPAPARRGLLEPLAIKNQAWPQIQVAPLSYAYTEGAQEWVSALPALNAELRGDQ